MGIASDYLQLMQTIGAKLQIPPVQEIYIAPFEPGPEKSSKIICTGTVLVNQTLDDLLPHFGNARQIFIVGFWVTVTLFPTQSAVTGASGFGGAFTAGQ